MYVDDFADGEIVSAWGKVRAQDSFGLRVFVGKIVSAWGKVRAQDCVSVVVAYTNIVSAWGKVRAQDGNDDFVGHDVNCISLGKSASSRP